MSDALPPIRIPVANPAVGPRETAYVLDCLETNWISSAGKYLGAFEKAFAERLGGGHAVAVGNGTVAIDLALAALGIGAGDEVIVPGFTFAGSVSPILRRGAVPILAPTARDLWNVDDEAIPALITPRTKAIIAVHLYGVPCEIARIAALCREHGLHLIEDCAESLGARLDGKFVGHFGDVATFSFFGNKVLTTGEGGMCLCRDAALAERVVLFRDHGMEPHLRYWHKVAGYNGRMTNLQAAVGLGQLESLDAILTRREEIHGLYQERLAGQPYLFPVTFPVGSQPVTWLESPVLAPGGGLDRDALARALRLLGIDSRPFFFPLNRTPAYSRFGRDDPHGDFFASHGLNLPTYPAMTDDEVREVADAFHRIAGEQWEKGARGTTVTLRVPDDTAGLVAPQVSIILPTYNEEGNAHRIVAELRTQMIHIGHSFEILIMDDNSVDRTVAEIDERFRHDPRVRPIVRTGNRGLALSIRDGIGRARGEFVLVMDSDFNHDPAVTGQMASMAHYYDIVSGSRFTTGGGMQSKARWFFSLLFNLWIRLLLFLPTQDNLAGFYCIRRKKLEELDLDDIFRNYGDYFFRLLHQAQARKFSILEIPVWYRDRDYGVSKTPFVRTLLLYTREAIRLRLRAWFDGGK